MEHYELFEFYFFKDGKYQIDFFKEKINWENTKRFKDCKFKYLQTLINCFKKNKLDGYPSNTGVNGWARHSIKINHLDIVWISNFSYENTTMGFSPRVEIFFKGKKIKSIQDINTTKKFVKILNYYIDESNVIKLIENEYGIEKCYKKIVSRINKTMLLEIYNS